MKLVSTLFLLMSTLAFADNCTIDQVMDSIHSKAAYSKFDYAGNADRQPGAPSQLGQDGNQYSLWISSRQPDGIYPVLFPDLVTYEPGKCVNGEVFVNDRWSPVDPSN